MSKRDELKPEEKTKSVENSKARQAILKLSDLAESIIVDERFNPDMIEHVTREEFDRKQTEGGGSKSRGKLQAMSDRYQDRDFSKLVIAEVNLHNIKRQTLDFCRDLENKLSQGETFTAYDIAGLEDAKTDLEKLATHHYEYQNYEYRRTRGELSRTEGAKHKLMGGMTSQIIFTAGQLAAVGLVHTACQYGSRAAILHATAAGVIEPSQSVKDALEKLNEVSPAESTAMATTEIAAPSTLTGVVASTVLSDKNLSTVTEQLVTQIQAEMERVGAANTTELPDSSIREIATNVATTILPNLSKEDVTNLLEANSTTSSTPINVPDNYDSLSVQERIDLLETLPDFAVSSSYLPNDAFPKGSNLVPALADFVIASTRNVFFTRLDFSYEAEKSKQKLDGKLNPKPKPKHPKLAAFKDSFIKSAHRQVYLALCLNLTMAVGFGAAKAALDNDQDKSTKDKMNEFIQSVGVSGLWSVVTGVANATIDAGRSLAKLGATGQQLLKIIGRVGIRGALQFGKGIALDGKDMAKAGIEALILGVGSGAGKELISAGIIIGKEKLALPVGKNPTYVANYISTLAEMGTKHRTQPVVNLVKQLSKTIPGNNTFEIVNPHRYETPEVMKPVYIQSPMSPPKVVLQENLLEIRNPEQLQRERSRHLDVLKENVSASVNIEMELDRLDSGIESPTYTESGRIDSGIESPPETGIERQDSEIDSPPETGIERQDSRIDSPDIERQDSRIDSPDTSSTDYDGFTLDPRQQRIEQKDELQDLDDKPKSKSKKRDETLRRRKTEQRLEVQVLAEKLEKLENQYDREKEAKSHKQFETKRKIVKIIADYENIKPGDKGIKDLKKKFPVDRKPNANLDYLRIPSNEPSTSAAAATATAATEQKGKDKGKETADMPKTMTTKR